MDRPEPAAAAKGKRAMKKICLANQKGGCGKTTTAISLSSCLANQGKKVLLIDLDPQGHSGLGFGVKPEQVEDSIYEVLMGRIPMNAAVRMLKKNLYTVSSNVVLSAFEQLMAGLPEREYKLTQALAHLEDNFDYVIIDCPPSLGLLTFNALMAADEIIIPVDSSSFSLNGLDKLLETVKLIEEKAGHWLPYKILATNIDRRTKFSKRVVKKLQTQFGEKCFETTINTCTRIREAASDGKPIDAYDRHCTAFRDYQNLTTKILEEEIKIQVKVFAGVFDPKGGEGQTQPAESEVVFTFRAPGHTPVQIAGSFNSWTPEPLRYTEFQGNPVWKMAIRLKPGTYQYKYLVDGRWIHDPQNKDTIDDFLGGVNSIVNV
jgi:chromosome partitioning protein